MRYVGCGTTRLFANNTQTPSDSFPVPTTMACTAGVSACGNMLLLLLLVSVTLPDLCSGAGSCWTSSTAAGGCFCTTTCKDSTGYKSYGECTTAYRCGSSSPSPSPPSLKAAEGEYCGEEDASCKSGKCGRLYCCSSASDDACTECKNTSAVRSGACDDCKDGHVLVDGTCKEKKGAGEYVWDCTNGDQICSRYGCVPAPNSHSRKTLAHGLCNSSLELAYDFRSLSPRFTTMQTCKQTPASCTLRTPTQRWHSQRHV